ncbi:MAG: GNAT family N-acetyltransferase [Verrucomicrobium sp.]
MKMNIRLLPIREEGKQLEPLPELPAEADGILEMNRSLYAAQGFVPPWIAYLAVDDSGVKGTCAFKSPPVNGRVEIAYFSFPGNEAQGLATEMARQMVQMAREADASMIITAKTLLERNASHRVLEKNGFVKTGTAEDAEVGTVQEWRWDGSQGTSAEAHS